MTIHQGGCLCGALRFETVDDPLRVVVCHCKFCQRATGTAYMVEVIFPLAALRVTQGVPAQFSLPSAASGKQIHIHFCAGCGTKLWLSFERFRDILGVYGGTFDDPNCFSVGPHNSKHIFLDSARPDSLVPPHTATYRQHATTLDGKPEHATVYEEPRIIGTLD